MGKLVFQRVTKNVSEETFDCGVESINDYVRNSYYPSIAQHAYAYNISGNGKSLGYIQPKLPGKIITTPPNLVGRT